MESRAPRLILEYAPFGSPLDASQVTAISAEEDLEILRQNLSALRYLHERRDAIVHREIRLGNILVQSRDPLHIKLSDFGFSKEKEDSMKTHVGTNFYAAPEIAARKSYGPSLDIWSLGMVIFQFAHGLPDYNRVWVNQYLDGLP